MTNQQLLVSDEPITVVPGFQAAGVAAGIKKHGGLDLALVVSERPCSAAAVFTTNQVQAAPVQYDRSLIEHNSAALRGVVINSGCANAVTGTQGLQNTIATASAVETALVLPKNSMFVMSTGVIGQQLPMEHLLPGITTAVEQLDTTLEAGNNASQAIMTTDTWPKQAAIRYELGGQLFVVAGMCKGAGMIHPNMATLLALVCTNAAVTPSALDVSLRQATDQSFNCMTVDGDTSTNDTLLVLANGAAGNPPISLTSGVALRAFQTALTAVCVELAKMVARDGEGATKFVTIEVTGARSFEDARHIGRTIATSNLVKTAIFGTDANWGRVLMAVGRSGIRIDPRRLALWFGNVQLVGAGAPLPYDETDAHAALSDREVVIRVDLGLGGSAATVWTCDFSHEYVSINADYRT